MTMPDRVLRAVYDAHQFNALRHRLPRVARRSVEPAPPGHVGLIVQIVSADDRPLTAAWSHVPDNADPTHELSRLEAKARRQLQ
jgi:hypothetical protein